jgi:hypothetical protein
MEIEVDSGAGVSIISLSDYKKFFIETKLKESSRTLRSVNHELLKVAGEITVLVQYNNKKFKLSLIVVDERKFTMLVGREWLDKLERLSFTSCSPRECGR